MVFWHGGGFRQGDKAGVPPVLLEECLAGGMSVASGNYRLSDQAPFPAPMLDGARAIQFLRSKAGEWEIDPGHLRTTRVWRISIRSISGKRAAQKESEENTARGS